VHHRALNFTKQLDVLVSKRMTVWNQLQFVALSALPGRSFTRWQAVYAQQKLHRPLCQQAIQE
jgi:hypothetical protein